MFTKTFDKIRHDILNAGGKDIALNEIFVLADKELNDMYLFNEQLDNLIKLVNLHR